MTRQGPQDPWQPWRSAGVRTPGFGFPAVWPWVPCFPSLSPCPLDRRLGSRRVLHGDPLGRRFSSHLTQGRETPLYPPPLFPYPTSHNPPASQFSGLEGHCWERWSQIAPQDHCLAGEKKTQGSVCKQEVSVGAREVNSQTSDKLTLRCLLWYYSFVLFFTFLPRPHGLQDLNSLTRDLTQATAMNVPSHHRTTRDTQTVSCFNEEAIATPVSSMFCTLNS